MKKYFILLAVFFICFLSPFVYCAVTTSDGAITLDFYEDTQSGIDNRWILDFTVNDIDGPGGLEEIYFNLEFLSVSMDYDNQYNQQSTDFYRIGHNFSGTIPIIEYPTIDSPMGSPIPVGTNLKFYAMPDIDFFPDYDDCYLPVMGTYYIRTTTSTNNETLYLFGPIGFDPVPEPMSMALFAFGVFFLKYLKKGC